MKAKRSFYSELICFGIGLIVIGLLFTITTYASDAPVKHEFDLKDAGDDNLTRPADVEAASNGEIFVLDTVNNRIVVYDQKGNYLRKFGDSGDDKGEFEAPLALDVDEQNRVYVADTENHRIQVLNSKGDYLFEFGGEGEKEGKLNRPIGISIGNNGLVYVSDLKNHRIQVFTQEGEFVKKIGKYGRREGEFKYPVGLTTAPEINDLYVVDGLNFRVQIFEQEEEDKWKLNKTFGRVGNREGSFARPKDIAIDNKKRIYVTDSFLGLVQILDNDGNFLFKIGGESKKTLFNQAFGICIDNEQNRLYVADRGYSQIQVYKITDIK